jgi:hypothetical protein
MAYVAERYDADELVRVVGSAHALTGKVGTIISRDPVNKHKWRVRIGRQVFLVQNKNLEKLKIGGTD